MLSRLAVHYYRPDFTASAAQSLFADMVEDLAQYPMNEIEQAIKDYRRDPEAQFFPKSGQLIAIINKNRPIPCRLETFKGYPDPQKRPIKTANEILAKYGFTALNGEKPYIPLPYATDKTGPVTQELKYSKLVRAIRATPHKQ